MVSKVQWYDRFTTGEGDKLFFDANVWIYIEFPGWPGDPKTGAYSYVLKKALDSNLNIYTDSIVLSEFVNRIARLRYKFKKPEGEPENFKQFRKTPDFVPIAEEIADAVRRIIEHCQRIDTPLRSVDIYALIADFESYQRDFNDLVIAETCRHYGFMLVTDDDDFKDVELDIITANEKLLD